MYAGLSVGRVHHAHNPAIARSKFLLLRATMSERLNKAYAFSIVEKKKSGYHRVCERKRGKGERRLLLNRLIQSHNGSRTATASSFLVSPLSFFFPLFLPFNHPPHLCFLFLPILPPLPFLLPSFLPPLLSSFPSISPSALTGDQVLALVGVPRHVRDGSPVGIPQLTPRLLLLEVPHDA